MLALTWLAVIATALPALGAVWALLHARRRRALALAGAAGVALLAGALLGGQDLALQKVVSALIMPLALWWLALLLVTLWALARAPRGLGRALLALWLVLTVMGNGWLASASMRWWEARIPAVPLPAEPLDVIAIPGGGAGFAADGVTAQVGDFGDRVVLGARLFNNGRTRRLLTTGSTIEGISGTFDLTLASRMIWRDLGVPDAAIIGLADPKNTSQEIIAIQALARREGWTRIGMLGSGFHLPRILALCSRAGLEVVPIVADRRAGAPPFHPLFAVPSANALRTLTLVAWEVIGRAVGR